MKGRLTYNSVNNMVDGINLTLTTKYDLMHNKPSKLSGAKAKKYYQYKEQENKNTKGGFVTHGLVCLMLHTPDSYRDN